MFLFQKVIILQSYISQCCVPVSNHKIIIHRKLMSHNKKNVTFIYMKFMSNFLIFVRLTIFRIMEQAFKIPGLWLLDSAGAVKIDHDNITYCYHNNDITKIVYSTGRYTIAHISLKKIENKLCQKRFFRCHRNYIINLDHIGHLSEKGDTIIVGAHTKILVARRRRSKLLHMLDQFKSKVGQNINSQKQFNVN